MAVIVDKARGDDAAGGVDRARGRAAQLADLGDLAVFDSDIATKRRHPRAVDDPAVLDQQVIRHCYPFPRWNHKSRFSKVSVTRSNFRPRNSKSTGCSSAFAWLNCHRKRRPIAGEPAP